ncbi:NAD(P)/FAD-dependent oxidoreductase [Aliidiomarina halalkaliphila]|uniref:NAD(P)/FAD-dependent oxidoreductase n=1 Tax=Aliidiomarina halalkaliphila TaxID=2593535 RepID=A0A552X124_9GAMM|nr:NAD(P)/FAD-dependent oxidoreductase [Aliidiomarina halalkaliphila]TRW48293.1 NAD(P)/FAD-dependent oxidoreductase [Aliidiomarina halalkaliphila]
MSTAEPTYDVIVIGAGAAGLMCGLTAGQRNKRVLVLDHAKQAGKKILISGGGRCNFTNMHTSPEQFLSQNPHFCKSALSRYTQWDFLAMVEKHQIAWHEKTLGQLFCDDSAKDIVAMLMHECKAAGTRVQLRTEILSVRYTAQYHVDTSEGMYIADKLVVACGGLSMPKLGATPLGYQLAKQFNHTIVPVRAGLVPFTLHDHDKASFAELTGVATDVVAEANHVQFKEAMLFTHRGLSGPAMLQISSFWEPGDNINVNLLPNERIGERLRSMRAEQPKLSLANALSRWLPKRLVQVLIERGQWPNKNLADLSNQAIDTIDRDIHGWVIKPNGTEGYRTAEVTLGGVNVDEVSSKTMESLKQPGLYFIGEVLDVTGWLGGYNFQWAWSSGWVAGQSV